MPLECLVSNMIYESWMPVFRNLGRATTWNYNLIADFNDIPRCGFQQFRACGIFEKYLMHGATHNVKTFAWML